MEDLLELMEEYCSKHECNKCAFNIEMWDDYVSTHCTQNEIFEYIREELKEKR